MRGAIAAIFCLTAASSACALHQPRRAAAQPLPEWVVDTTAHFQLHVDRRVDPARRFALLAAERYAPTTDSVRAAAARARPRFEKSPIANGQWWYDSFDGTRIPFALTDDAVRYYISLLNDLAQHQGEGAGHPRMMDAEFHYTATVRRADSIPEEANRPRDGYVVELTMQWSQWCGNLCALVLGKTRRVWVAKDGRVLAVDGDGLTRFVVSELLPPGGTAQLAIAEREIRVAARPGATPPR